MARYPGHSYLGPGNDLEGEFSPTDYDDVIAYYHDVAYGEAANKGDVKAADLAAIWEFIQDFKDTGNFHSALAASGLSAKYLFESILHKTVYPSLQVRKNGTSTRSYEYK